MLSHSQLTSVLKATPNPALILYPGPEFIIAFANQAYLDAVNMDESSLIGKHFLDVASGPDDQNSAESSNMSRSLNQVMAKKAAHQMDVQKYNIISHPSGDLQTRYRLPVNTPIMQDDGKIDLILHTFTDITEMEEKQDLLDKAYKLANIGTWEYDLKTQHLSWSTITKEVHGFGPEYVPDVESTVQLFKEGYNRDVFAQAVANALEHFKPFDVELKIISGQGDERWIRATGEPEFKEGVCIRFYGISQNVSNRKQAEEDIKYNEQRFKALVQDGSDLIAILDESANYLYVSPTSLKVLGIPAEYFIGKNAFTFIHTDDIQRVSDNLNELPMHNQTHIEPFRFADKDGNWRWIESTVTNMMEDPAVRGLVVNSRDVTDQISNQQRLIISLKEKETLLAEIHHRVKNNLAVVSGLMQLQAFDEENNEVKGRLYDCVVRIKTMANIHEQLYQSESFSQLKLADNIRVLVSDIIETFQLEIPLDITYQCESVELNIVQAIPFSLIINEIITNILKHAFLGRNAGAIEITLLEHKKKNQIKLIIKDNGVGLPDDFSIADSSSLGLNLIYDLSDQLKAVNDFNSSEGGTIFTLQFEKSDVNRDESYLSKPK
ncbi:MAG: PAS domain S-box protein [Balneolales bacterium]